ncbi:MAG: primosomal protein N' [Thermotogae bacterium]|nr:primosomal protein N' [Thermotogota bacterium]
MKAYLVLTPWGEFSYLSDTKLEVGEVVKVPLRKRQSVGVILKEVELLMDLKGISERLGFVIPKELLKLMELLSSYYLTPKSRFLPLLLPPSLQKTSQLYYKRVETNPPRFKAQKHLELWEYLSNWRTPKAVERRFGKGATHLLRSWHTSGHLVMRERMRVPRPREVRLLEYSHPYPLPEKPTPEQERILFRIRGALHRKRYSPFLLWGETGSGKTYVYLRAAEEALKRGKKVLILVPEILLSYHIAHAFQETFGEDFALFHSGISPTQRASVWFAALKGELKVVMGVKTGVFLPLQDLGLIVVDEEHEGTYKESDRPPLYNARDVAVLRGFLNSATVILGSATPSLESFHNVKTGKYHLLRLRERVVEYDRPKVEVVDMKRETFPFSSRFRELLKTTLDDGKGAIVFINRRGFLPYYFCEDCGNPIKCPNCDSVLALHRNREGREFLKCHVCGYSRFPPSLCPVCGGPNLKGSGTGTQKVEELLKREYNVPVARLDTDSVRSRRRVVRVLEDFASGKVRILVGTKMVIKGLDFKNVGFVGVINADSFLMRPSDFRAEEKTFQTLRQVIGRIRTGGYAVLQTRLPTHWVIRHIIEDSPERFYVRLYRNRKLLLLPPFRKMAIFEVRTKKREKWMINERILENFVKNYNNGLTIWGPYFPALAKRKGWYRVRMAVLSESSRRIGEVAERLRHLPLSGYCLWDVDPLELE